MPLSASRWMPCRYFFYKVVDKMGIDGIINGLGKGTIETSKGLRLLQTGNVGFYIFMMVGGYHFHINVPGSR